MNKFQFWPISLSMIFSPVVLSDILLTTKVPNLEMEPKCLTKSDVHLMPDISRTKNDKRILQKALKQLMSRDCNDVSCL